MGNNPFQKTDDDLMKRFETVENENKELRERLNQSNYMTSPMKDISPIKDNNRTQGVLEENMYLKEQIDDLHNRNLKLQKECAKNEDLLFKQKSSGANDGNNNSWMNKYLELENKYLEIVDENLNNRQRIEDLMKNSQFANVNSMGHNNVNSMGHNHEVLEQKIRYNELEHNYEKLKEEYTKTLNRANTFNEKNDILERRLAQSLASSQIDREYTEENLNLQEKNHDNMKMLTNFSEQNELLKLKIGDANLKVKT